MKKLLIIILVAGSVLISAAQVPKGTILVGASSDLGFSTFKPDGGTSTNSFGIDANGGYFIIDNLVVGANLGLNRSDFGTVTTTRTALGLFGRYYIMGKIFVGAGFNALGTKNDSGTVTTESSSIQGNLHAGYAIFITPNIAVEPAVNMNIESGDSDGFGIGLGAGFTLFLNRK